MPTYTKRAPERDAEHEGSLAFTVSKPFTPHTLDLELSEAHNWRKDAGLVVEGDPYRASVEDPVIVWVLREDADVNTVRRVVSAHQGVEGGPDELAVLRAKASAGEELTRDEIQTALRLLLMGG